MERSKIILTGFMGCGKSTIGRLLAEQKGILCTDTDFLIEKEQGRTISEIFETDGEEAFRDMETDCLRSLLQQEESCVVSLGGGLPVGGSLSDGEAVRERTYRRGEVNRSLLKELGTVFYLKASPEELYGRLKGDTTRPLLQTEDPYARICQMLRSREEWYEKCADEVIETDGRSPQEIADEIAGRMKQHETTDH